MPAWSRPEPLPVGDRRSSQRGKANKLCPGLCLFPGGTGLGVVREGTELLIPRSHYHTPGGTDGERNEFGSRRGPSAITDALSNAPPPVVEGGLGQVVLAAVVASGQPAGLLPVEVLPPGLLQPPARYSVATLPTSGSPATAGRCRGSGRRWSTSGRSGCRAADGVASSRGGSLLGFCGVARCRRRWPSTRCAVS